MTPTEIEGFMSLAIFEGRKARAKSGPNPPVGCVLVRDGIVVGMGHTSEPGGPHAEVVAMNAVDRSLEGVTCFVTLEPCSFVGRTPSCARELIKSGVKSVVIGAIDPHPRNRGAGIDILIEAGVNVNVGVLEERVRAELTEHFSKYS